MVRVNLKMLTVAHVFKKGYTVQIRRSLTVFSEDNATTRQIQ